jgi:hypothetical protein
MLPNYFLKKGFDGTTTNEILRRVEELLEARAPGIPRESAKIVVTVMETAVNSMLTLIGRSDSVGFKARASTEVKRMLTLCVDDVIHKQCE